MVYHLGRMMVSLRLGAVVGMSVVVGMGVAVGMEVVDGIVVGSEVVVGNEVGLEVSFPLEQPQHMQLTCGLGCSQSALMITLRFPWDVLEHIPCKFPVR